MTACFTLLLTFAFVLQAQAPARNVSATPTSIHVIASSGELLGKSAAGTRITGVIDGQPLVLHSFKELNPLMPGTYQVRITHDDKPHGAELDQQYTLTLPDGKEVPFYLEAVCERGTAVCNGVSIK